MTGDAVGRSVERIIEQVRAGGDGALIELTRRYDRVRLRRADIAVGREEISRAGRRAGKAFRVLLRSVARNIAAYHERQRPRPALFRNAHGARVGWRHVPLDRVGVYIPGGTAPLVSTALMTLVPARVAGVGEAVVCTPPGPGGKVNPYLLAACRELGAARVFRVGGAQAVAAMAFGTETVPRVDAVVGPGNRYVTEAKRRLYGTVGIDMTAGPSEVAVIADGTADPALVAADMLSQAEHDPSSGVALFATSAALARAVRRELARQARGLPRAAIARAALKAGVRIVVCRSLREAADRADRMAPEHLEVMTRDPRAVASDVRHAGAVFVGPWSATALGDYVAGPSHVLPTGGTARFFSVLSLEHFMRRVSVIEYDRPSFGRAAGAAEALAAIEGLDAHARALRMRRRPRRRR
ncbi:MAG: histidinol dehydrogenase [bacterium]|nr:histidinol dehydrogenase [bacterium]